MPKQKDWAVEMVPTGEPWVAIFPAENEEQAIALAEDDTKSTLLCDFVELRAYLAMDEDRRFAVGPRAPGCIQWLQVLKWYKPEDKLPPEDMPVLCFYEESPQFKMLQREVYEADEPEEEEFVVWRESFADPNDYEEPDLWAQIEIPVNEKPVEE